MRRLPAAAHDMDRCQIGSGTRPHGRPHGGGTVIDQLQSFLEPVLAHRPVAVHHHRWIGALVTVQAYTGGEHGTRRALKPASDRLDHSVGHLHLQAGEHPVIIGVEAVEPLRTYLAVAGTQAHGGCPEQRDQFVQRALAEVAHIASVNSDGWSCGKI
ncbi:hypothetical protein SMALA_8252 [Streptomyces malaysiensis subsp. malaysiensis]|nr:hypothetical protein SMALA_8252 [Streptomyces malaysiensis]